MNRLTIAWLIFLGGLAILVGVAVATPPHGQEISVKEYELTR